MLLPATGQETGHILERHQRNEASRFVRSIDIQHTGQESRLIRYYTNRLASQAGKADHHILGKMRHHLEKIMVINHRFDHILNVIGNVQIIGNHLL